MDKANNKQVGGTHYKQFTDYEPWDVVNAWGLGYLDGTALKYLSRWKHKNGVEDLKKCVHFIEKLIETELAKFPPSDVAKRPLIRSVRRPSIPDDALVQLFGSGQHDAPAWSANLNTEAVLRPDTDDA